jgi:hypothetical protein
MAKNQDLSIEETLGCLAACSTMGFKDDDVLSWSVGKLP